MAKLIVTKEHISAFPNPLKLVIDEKVIIEKKETIYEGWIWVTTKNENSGWIPEQFLKIKNNKGIVQEAYDATELNVNLGESLSLHREVNSWYWVENKEGELGWIPKYNVYFL